MISVYKIKPAFQNLLRPVLSWLRRLGITPNQLTLLSILLSIVIGALFYYHPNNHLYVLVIPFGLLIRMALNALDGMMATEYQMKSKLGEVLNELGDVISDVAIIIPFIVLPAVHSWVVVLFAILAIINEYAGVLGKAISGTRRYEGPMGKSDRALVLGIFCLAYYFWNDTQLYADWFFGIASLLIVVSTITRIKKSIK